MVKIYSKQSCAPCQQAKKYMDRLGIVYIVKDVEQDQSAYKELVEVYGYTSVPVIVHDNGVITGYIPSAIAKLKTL